MSGDQPYRLKFSGLIKEHLQRLLADADAAGIGKLVGESLIEIEGHLESYPREWGDPVKYSKAFSLTLYRRVFDNLCVEYSVHDSEPYVWLSRIEPVLGHPLCSHDEQ